MASRSIAPLLLRLCNTRVRLRSEPSISAPLLSYNITSGKIRTIVLLQPVAFEATQLSRRSAARHKSSKPVLPIFAILLPADLLTCLQRFVPVPDDRPMARIHNPEIRRGAGG